MDKFQVVGDAVKQLGPAYTINPWAIILFALQWSINGCRGPKKMRPELLRYMPVSSLRSFHGAARRHRT
jgi:hypothetical protein